MSEKMVLLFMLSVRELAEVTGGKNSTYEKFLAHCKNGATAIASLFTITNTTKRQSLHKIYY